MAETATTDRYTFTGQGPEPEAPAVAPAPEPAPDVPPVLPVVPDDQYSDPDDVDSALVPEDSAPAAPVKVPGWQRRIDRQTRRLHALEESNRALAAQVETLTKGQTTPSPATEPAAGKPTPDDYPTYDAYLEALAEHVSEQKAEAKFAAWTAAQTEAQQARAQEAQQATLEQAWQVSLAKAQAAHDDFFEVLEDWGTLPKSNEMIAELYQSPHGGELVYYLLHHPTEALQLSQLTGRPFARAFDALEAKVVAPAPQDTSPPAPPALSYEPPPARAAPIRPVQSTTGNARAFNPDTAPYQDYKRARREGRI